MKRHMYLIIAAAALGVVGCGAQQPYNETTPNGKHVSVTVPSGNEAPNWTTTTIVTTPEITTVVVPNDVLFASGSADLSATATDVIADLAKHITTCAASTVTIDGYTDSDGDEAFNQQLSHERATSVASRLMAAGVAAQITTRGLGESQPIAANISPQNKQRNRRVAISFQCTP